MSITCSTILDKPITKKFLKNHIKKWLKLTPECTLEFRNEDENGFWVGCEHCGFCDVSISGDGRRIHTATWAASRGELGIAISRICEDILVEEMGSGSIYSVESSPDTEWVFDGKKWEKKVDENFWKQFEENEEKDSIEKSQL